MSNPYKILIAEWRSGRHTVGFIAYETDPDTGEWNAVVGVAPEGGISETYDAQYIAAWGAKLSVEEARVIFPELDITKFKYYDKTTESSTKTN